jgi:hypothetical protein
MSMSETDERTNETKSAGSPSALPYLRALAVFLLVMIAIVFANQWVIHSVWPEEYPAPTDLSITRLEPRHQGGDSWYPMIMAVIHLESASEVPVYDYVFFQERVKFQYPLSSLHPVAASATMFPKAWQRSVKHLNYYDNLNKNLYRFLNRVSFIFYVIAIGATGWILMTGMSALARREGRTMGNAERATFVVLGCLLAFLYYPLLKAYTQGQVQSWLNALFALSLLCWMHRREGLAGALLGVSCLFKPQIGLLLLWGLLRRRWSFSACFAIVFGAGMIVSILSYGLHNHLGYLKVLSFISRTGEGYFANQSINGLMNRLLGNGNNTQWLYNEFAPYHPVVYWTTTLGGIALVAFALLWRVRSRIPPTAIEYCIISLTAVMVSPVAWEHHYGVLAPMYAVALPWVLRFRPLDRLSLPTLMVSFVLTGTFMQFTNLLAETPFNFLQSYLFFGALLFLVLLYPTAGLGEAGHGNAL